MISPFGSKASSRQRIESSSTNSEKEKAKEKKKPRSKASTKKQEKKEESKKNVNDDVGNSRDSISDHQSDHLGDQQRVSQIAIGSQIISWKSDPEASFSDWRIEITSPDARSTDVFYLHRNIIGFGPRKSDYLRKAFIQQKKDVVDTNVTKLKLPEYQAKVFPMVLDYIYYTREAKQTLTASRACAMSNVAERLSIVSLQKALVEFYRKNVALGNMEEFLNCAKEAKAQRLLSVSKAKIGTMIIQKPELAGLVPPEFLAEIIEVYRKQFEELQKKDPKKKPSKADLAQSRHLSKAAYVCVSHSENTMTEKLFEQLTSERALPVIDVSVALPFLAMSAKFGKGGSKYTNLQRRCVKSVTEDWSSFQKQFSSPGKVSDALKRLPSHVLADILVMTMNK